MRHEPPEIDSEGDSPTRWEGDRGAGEAPEGAPGEAFAPGMVSAGESPTWAEDQLKPFLPQGSELDPDLIREQEAVLLKTGDVVAKRFEVVKQLGFGGMGAVYHVKDRHLGLEKALKVMLPSLLRSEGARQRFRSEVAISQQLSHDNIVRVYDLAADKRRGFYFFTMEYVEGRTLHRLLQERGGRLPVDEALGIAHQLCDALEYAHRNTIHRDLKPQNIMVRPDGSIKVLDFGLAKLMSPGRLAKSSMALGTAYYQAPEQGVHLRELDQRADIYSFGVILYQMLTGEIPVGRVKRPSQISPETPKGLDTVVLTCLEPNAEERYESASALRSALGRATQRRSKVKWAVPMATALVILALSLFLVIRQEKRTPAGTEPWPEPPLSLQGETIEKGEERAPVAEPPEPETSSTEPLEDAAAVAGDKRPVAKGMTSPLALEEAETSGATMTEDELTGAAEGTAATAQQPSKEAVGEEDLTEPVKEGTEPAQQVVTLDTLVGLANDGRLPKKRELPLLPKLLESLAEEKGVQLRLEALAGRRNGRVEKVPFNVEARGTSDQVDAFINALKAFKFFFDVTNLERSMSVSSVNSRVRNTGEARCIATTYVLLEEEAQEQSLVAVPMPAAKTTSEDSEHSVAETVSTDARPPTVSSPPPEEDAAVLESLSASPPSGVVSLDPEMVFIKGGTFAMGSESPDAYSDEAPVHTVTVSDFYLSRYEITATQFAAFLNERGALSSRLIGLSKDCTLVREGDRFRARSGCEYHPANEVTWYGALEFCRWLERKTGRSCRLPTEAEWEYAARGAAQRVYPWGNSVPSPSLALFDQPWVVPSTSLKPVYSFPRGGTPGTDVYHLAGNVWEWCMDLYDKDYYRRSPQHDPTGTAGGTTRHVLRGGGSSSPIRRLRSTSRFFDNAYSTNCQYGFRVVRKGP